ncbi:MAG TPA: lysylphosphatidylglycerol synthase transmembrane domain-containing protein [Pyrinomonadaceae bacterium]
MRRYLKFIILTLVAAAVLWWFGRGLDWASVRAAIGKSDWRLIALAVLIVWGTYFVRALRWRALLAPLTEASLRELFAATTVGFSAVFLIGRAGEVVRPTFLPLRDRRVRPAAAFVTIGVERIYDMVAVVVLFAVNLIWFRAPGGGDAAAYARVRQAGMLLLVAAAVGIFALVVFKRYSRQVIDWCEAKFARAPPLLKRAGKLLTHLLEQVAGALSVLVSARELAVTVGLTALLWGIIAVANWLVLRAFGLPFGATETLFVLGWALVGSLVPTPGGAAGAFHAATAAGLIFLGIAREEAAAISIVLHLVVFAPAVVFGLYYFLRSDVSFERLRSLTATEPHEDEEEERGDERDSTQAGRAAKDKAALSELSRDRSAGAET